MAMAAHRAVGAVVAALLSAVTEPVVNNMLVERLSLMEAVKNFGSHEDHKVLADHPGDEFHEHFEKQHICQYQKTKLSSSPDRKTGCVGIDLFCHDPAGHQLPLPKVHELASNVKESLSGVWANRIARHHLRQRSQKSIGSPHQFAPYSWEHRHGQGCEHVCHCCDSMGCVITFE
jgi:hypothetical protein